MHTATSTGIGSMPAAQASDYLTATLRGAGASCLLHGLRDHIAKLVFVGAAHPAQTAEGQQAAGSCHEAQTGPGPRGWSRTASSGGAGPLGLSKQGQRPICFAGHSLVDLGAILVQLEGGHGLDAAGGRNLLQRLDTRVSRVTARLAQIIVTRESVGRRTSLASTSTLINSAPGNSAAIFSNCGPMRWHGPHHFAVKSTTTGCERRRASSAMGSPWQNSRQREHGP